MKLNSFKAEKVHGYLNYDINFFPELTFLIGINGAGKTSALKLILGLISPSYQFLNQIDYSFAELICSTTENEQDIIIRSTQDKKDNIFTLSLRIKEKFFDPISFPRYTASVEDIVENEEISLREQAIKEKFEFNETVKIIREVATPKFLGLDRKIYEGKNIDMRFRRHFFSNSKRRKNIDSSSMSAIDNSLEDVQFLIYDYFRKIAHEQPKISEEFKRKIFQLSFKFNEDHNLDSVPIETETLMTKKERVLEAIKSLEINFLDYHANNFFNKMADIINNKKEVDEAFEKRGDKSSFNQDSFKLLMMWVNNSSQIKRIDEIINFSQTYQEKIAELRAPIKRLENITSNFFKEGGKKIQIADDGEIKVQLRNGTFSSVFGLSSGEKQIIIMIAHLIFEEDQKPSGIFIIDEPELSLHISWQEIFVSSITEASPKTQFILATHSPSIISKVSFEKYCQDLNKLNY